MAKILVAEDSADNLDILTELLDDEGYEVLCATNASDTVAAARRDAPDAILLDLQMPDGPHSAALNERAGFDAARQIRAQAATRNTPIVLLSGYNAQLDAATLASSGCNATSPKPYDFSHLLTTLATLLDAS